MMNPFTGIGIEFHILQSFPVTCLNRDDVGAPKSAIVGGVQRARVSSQCWKRQVRLALHDMGVKIGIRTKKLAELLADACKRHGATEAQAAACATILANTLTKDTLFFLSVGEVDALAQYAQACGFTLPTEKKSAKKKNAAQEDETAGDVLAKTEMSKLKACLSSAKNRGRRTGYCAVRTHGGPGGQPERTGGDGLCPCHFHAQGQQRGRIFHRTGRFAGRTRFRPYGQPGVQFRHLLSLREP